MAEGYLPQRLVVLENENELRISADEGTCNVRISLESGLAEIFGAEMTPKKLYNFPRNSSISIFTWQGCTIKIIGNVQVTIVKDTLIMLRVILHAHLQERRDFCKEQGIKGPVTLIVGPTDVGKTTLCRFLLNYATRMSMRPLYVDLDVGQNSISVPGTVGVLAVDRPADIIQGYDTRAAKVYHFGYKNPNPNMLLYFLLLKHVGSAIKEGLRYASPTVRASGVIINTCGWCRGPGYDAITHASMAFEINNLFVLGEERLYSQLSRDMPANVKVHYMPKLDGVVERSRMQRIHAREVRIAEYFFGPLNQMRPHRIDMHISEVKIFSVVAQPVADDFDSSTVALDNITLQPVQLSIGLVDQVLALMKIDIDEVITNDLALTEVIGFVTVTRVFVPTGLISFLSPQPRPLPSNILLLGDMKLVNQVND